MKNLSNILFLALAFLCLFIVTNVFISFQYQYTIREDILNQKTSYTADEIMNIPSIPNISVTGIPIAALQANYFFAEGKYSKAVELLNQATEVNRYLHFSDFMMAKYFISQKNYDSVYYYSKKAFYGWPKSIEHFSNYLKLLAKDGDTTKIIEAAKFVSKDISDQAGYISILKMELNNAKFFHLVTSYPDAKPVNKKQLIGRWNRSYNFKGSKPVIDSTIVYSFQNNKVNIDDKVIPSRKETTNSNIKVNAEDLLYAVTHTSQEVKNYYAKYSMNRDDLLNTIKLELKKSNLKVNPNSILAEVERTIDDDFFQNNFLKSLKSKVSDIASAIASRNN